MWSARSNSRFSRVSSAVRASTRSSSSWFKVRSSASAPALRQLSLRRRGQAGILNRNGGLPGQRAEKVEPCGVVLLCGTAVTFHHTDNPALDIQRHGGITHEALIAEQCAEQCALTISCSAGPCARSLIHCPGGTISQRNTGQMHGLHVEAATGLELQNVCAALTSRIAAASTASPPLAPIGSSGLPGGQRWTRWSGRSPQPGEALNLAANLFFGLLPRCNVLLDTDKVRNRAG